MFGSALLLSSHQQPITRAVKYQRCARQIFKKDDNERRHAPHGVFSRSRWIIACIAQCRQINFVSDRAGTPFCGAIDTRLSVIIPRGFVTPVRRRRHYPMSWRRKRLFHIKRLRKLFIVYKDERVRVRFEVCGERNALVARRSLSEQTLRELYGNKSGNGGETMRANQNTLRVAPGFPSEGQRHFMERARKIFAAIVCRRCCLIFLKGVSSFFLFWVRCYWSGGGALSSLGSTELRFRCR